MQKNHNKFDDYLRSQFALFFNLKRMLIFLGLMYGKSTFNITLKYLVRRYICTCMWLHVYWETKVEHFCPRKKKRYISELKVLSLYIHITVWA